MGQIANQLPPRNEQDDFSDIDALVIHGPTWVNWMTFDAHARSVVLPFLRGERWRIVRYQGLRRIDAISPFLASEAMQ
jgi:hypothetical protein